MLYVYALFYANNIARVVKSAVKKFRKYTFQGGLMLFCESLRWTIVNTLLKECLCL